MSPPFTPYQRRLKMLLALKRYGVYGLKTLVTVGLLGWLLGGANVPALLQRLVAADPAWVAAAFFVKTLTIPLAAERWRVIAAAAGAGFGRLTALRVTLISLFFGQALPGAVGGDVVRGWLTYRLGFSPSTIVPALVVDRFAALVGVVAVMAVGLPNLLSIAPPGAGLLVVLAAAGCAAAGALALIIDRLPLPGWLRRPAIIAGALDMIRRIRAILDLRSGGRALICSALIHLCTVGAVFLYARALGLPVTAIDCLTIVPFSIIAAALPISLGGWGVREGSMVAGFALVGLPSDDALLLSLLIGVSVLFMVLPGAVAWLMWPEKPAAAPLAPLTIKSPS